MDTKLIWKTILVIAAIFFLLHAFNVLQIVRLELIGTYLGIDMNPNKSLPVLFEKIAVLGLALAGVAVFCRLLITFVKQKQIRDAGIFLFGKIAAFLAWLVIITFDIFASAIIGLLVFNPKPQDSINFVGFFFAAWLCIDRAYKILEKAAELCLKHVSSGRMIETKR